jgi:DNA modification methylase
MNPREPSKPLTRTEALRLAGRHHEADAAQRAYAKNRPPLVPFTTTLWDYPSRHYGTGTQGDQRYAGSTPAWVIWQLLHRYTAEGEAVLDPMCGSGTTLDVAADLKRHGIGFDLQPTRPAITRADARSLPLADRSVDFVFVDPPYSTHIAYSDDPRCIGKLDALQRPAPTPRGAGATAAAGAPANDYYQAMTRVIGELHRVLRDGRHLGLYVSDTFRKREGFEPIGFELFSIMRRWFTPVDIVAVVRRNAKLGKGNWRRSAEEEGFMMRGFNYLFIMRKDSPVPASAGASDAESRTPAGQADRTDRHAGSERPERSSRPERTGRADRRQRRPGR